MSNNKESISSNNKRIAKNTAVLYLRMILVMLVSLFTSRIVLQALGVEDFGIYSAVGGFIALFAVISNSLSAAISRFITFELGKQDKERLSVVFSTSVILQASLSLLIIALSETIGLWFLNNEMVIPQARMDAANWIFQFSIITFVINLISVPYNAVIIAHERMSAFAYIGIVEVLGKLGIALLLLSVDSLDLLILYSGLLCFWAMCIRLVYGWYCNRHFDECNFRFVVDKTQMQTMFSFAGWNFLGASSGVLRDQGVNVLLNIFCGPVANAARGIAVQVNSAVSAFSGSFISAINPQITKQFAAGNMDYTMKLVFQGAKMTYYLLFIVSLPVLIETKPLLELWLVDVPEHTVAFVRITLIYIMTESVSYTMVTLMLATGKIRNYQIIVGGCQLLNFPIAYLLLKCGLAPEYALAASIIVALCCLVLRLYMLNRMVKLPIRRFFKSVLVNVSSVSIISSILPIILSNEMNEGFARIALTIPMSVICTFIAIYYVGCSANERTFVLEKTKQTIQKIKQ